MRVSMAVTKMGKKGQEKQLNLIGTLNKLSKSFTFFFHFPFCLCFVRMGENSQPDVLAFFRSLSKSNTKLPMGPLCLV